MIQVLDTTLREGEQTPGVYFDSHVKLAIAMSLEKVGVDIIEAGHPKVDPDIARATALVASRITGATVAAHARSMEADVDAALECGVGFLGIFYCVSDRRLAQIGRDDLSSAIRRIADTIAYAKQRQPDLIIRYTPEDAVRSPFDNVVQASIAAVEAGAEVISLADTTGFMIPGSDRSLYDYITRFKETLALKGLFPRIAVHCHNDRGLALANALDGVRAGAEIIDATVLGLGERAGIVDLAQLLHALQVDLKLGKPWNLEALQDLYELVSRHAGVPVPVHHPLMGRNAFTHCAGVHTHAVAHNPVHYQSVDPAEFGRTIGVALDHMSGISSIRWALDKLEIEVDESTQRRVLEVVKSIGRRGRTVSLSELPYIISQCTETAEQQLPA